MQHFRNYKKEYLKPRNVSRIQEKAESYMIKILFKGEICSN